MGLFGKKKSMKQLWAEYEAAVDADNAQAKRASIQKSSSRKKKAQRTKFSDSLHQEYFDLAADISDAETKEETLIACRKQLALVDQYMAKEKSEYGKNPTKSVAALSAKCVRAAQNDEELLVQMAETINRYPNLSDDQAKRVRKALQKLGRVG